MNGRPLTARQREVLTHLKRGMVLRRPKGWRGYRLYHPGTTVSLTADSGMDGGQVLRLQQRFLEAFDAQTGEPLERASALGGRAIEFRLKPGVFE